jgi:two-component sensor histidine kinase
MRNQTVRLFLYSSIAIIALSLAWGFKSIPKQRDLAETSVKSSLEQELSTVTGAVRASTKAIRYELLDVLKAEGNDHVTRAFQDSIFSAATLVEFKDAQWRSLWHSSKNKDDFNGEKVQAMFKDWPLSKLNPSDTFFAKAGEVQGTAYFAVVVPVKRPSGIPMVGVGIFPASQFGLFFSADRTREVRVVDDKGFALALSRPAYLGASLRHEPLIEQILDADEVSARLQWKSENGTRLAGVGQRLGDSNLLVAIQAPLQFGSAWLWQSWLFLIFCTLAAIALNWYLVNSLMSPLLAQISTSDAMIEQLKRSLSEKPAAPGGNVAAPMKVSVIPETELEDFTFVEPAAAIVQQAVAESEPAKTSLAKIVKAAVRGQEGRLKEKNIHVQQTGLEDIEIENDVLQLQTAVEEILKNSIEAMSNSESKWITVIGTQESGRVNLKIEDTGMGIEKENLDKVFDPFFSTKDEQGVSRGLGLNVVRRVLEEMGGVVKIKNRELTSGVVVDLSWPVDVQSEIKSKPAVAAKPVNENALSAQALLDDLIGVGAPDDFAEVIMNAPLVKTEKFPEVAIRRPKVMRTLD